MTNNNKENDNNFDKNQDYNSFKENKKNIFIKIIDWCKRSFLHPTTNTIKDVEEFLKNCRLVRDSLRH